MIPTLSKVYEILKYNQMYLYFDKIFSKFQCGFQKGFNAQHCLSTMIEKWRRSVDGSGQAGALLTDLSKAWDYWPWIILTMNYYSKALCLRFW